MIFLQEIENLSREELIDIISFIEGINTKGILKLVGKTIGKGTEKAGKLLDKISNFFKKKISKNTTEISIEKKLATIFGKIKPFDNIDRVKEKIKDYDIYTLKFYLLCTLRDYIRCKEKTQESIARGVIRYIGKNERIKTDSKSEIEIEEEIFRKSMENLISRINKIIKDEDETDLEKEVNKHIAELSSMEKERMLKELRLNELSYRSLKKIFITGMSGIGIYTFAENAGFSLFMATSIFIKSISTILGITFPFIVYTGASTILGFLTGFFGISLILVGTSVVIITKNRNKLKSDILSLILLTIHCRSIVNSTE